MNNICKFIKNILIIFSIFVSSIQIANATDEYPRLKSKVFQPDINGVNLATGKYYPQLPKLSIPAAPRLSFTTVQKLVPQIRGIGNVDARYFTLTDGGETSSSFKCATEGCVSENGDGSVLAGSGTYLSSSDNIMVYRNSQSGVTILYTSNAYYVDEILQNEGVTSINKNGIWYATQINYPDGEVHTIEYSTLHTTETLGGVDFTYHRPTSINSSLGYKLNLRYFHDDLFDASPSWGQVKEAEIVSTDTPLTPLVKFTYSINEEGQLITDLSGRQWKVSNFTNATGSNDYANAFEIQLPGDSKPIIDVDADSSYHFVSSVSNRGQIYNYEYTGDKLYQNGDRYFDKLEVSGPEGYSRSLSIEITSNYLPRVTSDTDALGGTTSYTYHRGARIGSITFPEGNKEEYSYDSRGNLTQIRQIAKPDSGQDDIIITAEYNTTSCDFTSTFHCQRPKTITDGKGNVTEYSFSESHGGVLTKLEPENEQGVRRFTKYEYTANPVRLQKISVCSQNCDAANEQITTYTYWNSTSLPETITKTDGNATVEKVVTYSYDAAGRTLSIDGPLPGDRDATFYRYDDSGRKIWEVGAADSDGNRTATYYSLRTQDNQALTIETGVLTSPSDTTLDRYNILSNSYDDFGRKTVTKYSGISSTYRVKQYSYNSANNISCVVTRMNPSLFNGISSVNSACSLLETGGYGDDRVVQNDYDALGRISKISEGIGSIASGVEVEYGYTKNGKIKTITDGNNNTSIYTYDGFDRLQRIMFPDDTYKQLSYDENGNIVTQRKRDGEIFNYYYDALNALTSEEVPNESTIYTRYDAIGRKEREWRDTNYNEFTYDGLSRIESVRSNGRTLSYRYDIADRRTRLTYPDGFYISYNYDDNSSLSYIQSSDDEVISSYAYTPLSELTSLTRGNLHSTLFEYNDSRQLESHEHLGINRTTLLYNPANQIVSRSVSASDYQVVLPNSINHDYVVNNLNQYENVAGRAIDYDLNGNLTSYNSSTYSFDAHNRLVEVAQIGTTTSLSYDPAGRLISTTTDGSRIDYLYDGDNLVAEYNPEGTLLRRYVHGLQKDNPLLWYEGNGSDDKRYLYADERGSIISETSSNGSILSTHQYGPYGEPINHSSSRFRYTGQILIPGTELYHYKARVYNPDLGRFLQTDPIGYEDQVNLYAYVGNDPMNMVDPSGNVGKVINAGFKLVKNGGDLRKASREIVSDTIDSLTTFTDPSASALDKTVAVFDLFSPLSSKDIKNVAKKVDYSSIKNPPNVGSGKNFTLRQKQEALELNKAANGGVVKSDLSGTTLVKPQKSQRGVTPDRNEWQFDHKTSKNCGGTNCSSNLQILSREENRAKWDN